MSHAPRILIADDNEAAAKSLGRLLGLVGYETHLSFTGEQAIDAVEKFKPDAVLLDIGLPDIDGNEVARRLREKGHTTLRLIALSGYGQESDRQKATAAGFDGHLTKPARLAEIQKMIGIVPEVPSALKE